MPKNLTFIIPNENNKMPLPFIGDVKAGFPSPAADFAEDRIDINEELIKNPSTTFYARVNGSSMIDSDIHDGDILVIDKSLEPENGKVAVCFIDGEFTLKRIKVDKDCLWLMPANIKFEPIKVTEENDFVVWGVVTYVIKKL
jgi:DNA polymerase V